MIRVRVDWPVPVPGPGSPWLSRMTVWRGCTASAQERFSRWLPCRWPCRRSAPWAWPSVLCGVPITGLACVFTPLRRV